MAGHSKWANIKHKKAKVDAKRGKIFTKLIRKLTVAAKAGGSDIDMNPGLRLAVSEAQAANMPKDTIDRAVKRGAGEDDGTVYEEIRYEGYGQNGVAIMVDCLTDNRNRTVAEVRHAFTKHGGNMGTDGSVGYLFTKQGVISFEPGADEDVVMEVAIESGADDVITNDDGSLDVVTSPESFSDVLDALNAKDLKPLNAEVAMVAAVNVTLDLDTAEKIIKIVDVLEDLDDVQQVHTNADIPADVLEQLS